MVRKLPFGLSFYVPGVFFVFIFSRIFRPVLVHFFGFSWQWNPAFWFFRLLGHFIYLRHWRISINGYHSPGSPSLSKYLIDPEQSTLDISIYPLEFINNKSYLCSALVEFKEINFSFCGVIIMAISSANKIEEGNQ